LLGINPFVNDTRNDLPAVSADGDDSVAGSSEPSPPQAKPDAQTTTTSPNNDCVTFDMRRLLEEIEKRSDNGIAEARPAASHCDVRFIDAADARLSSIASCSPTVWYRSACRR
jgi:hypothetical protein